MKEELSITEQETLKKLERVIEKGLPSFYEVGAALLKIRDRKLYRADYKTFEEYCKTRWEMSRPRAYQLIDYAKVQTNLSTTVDKRISERQARPIARLEPKQQKEVWEEAERTAPKGKITGKHVERIAKRKFPKFLRPGKPSFRPIGQIEQVDTKRFDYSDDIADEIEEYVADLVDEYGERILCIEVKPTFKTKGGKE